MSTRLVLSLVLATSAWSCASVGEKRETATADIAALMRERTGFEPSTGMPQDGSIAEPARQLLAQPLTEEAAIRIALLNNRGVAAAFARLGVGVAELHQAGLLANPVLAANAKFFGGGTEIELGLTESLLDVFFVGARKRVAEAEFEATRLHIAEKMVGLVYDVRRAFVEVRAAERLLAVEREVLRAAQASVDLMGELHRAGNVTDPELTSEELGLARAKLAVARAEAGLVDAREPLNELLGLWGDAVNWTVDGALPEDPTAGLDLEHVESRAIQSSLMLAGVRSDASAEARRLGLVGWEAILDPGEVGLVAKREVDGGDWGLGPALGFSLPLFDSGGARRAAVTAALEASLADHVAGAVRVRSAARRLRERSAALADQVRFIRAEELPKSKRLVRETLRNYNAMQIGAFGVFVARQQEIESMQNYVETLREAWTARIDLEELLAGSYRESRVETEASDLRAASSSQGMKGKH